jgi:hypothetical protein
VNSSSRIRHPPKRASLEVIGGVLTLPFQLSFIITKSSYLRDFTLMSETLSETLWLGQATCAFFLLVLLTSPTLQSITPDMGMNYPI